MSRRKGSKLAPLEIKKTKSDMNENLPSVLSTSTPHGSIESHNVRYLNVELY